MDLLASHFSLCQDVQTSKAVMALWVRVVCTKYMLSCVVARQLTRTKYHKRAKVGACPGLTVPAPTKGVRNARVLTSQMIPTIHLH
jgi:hypothetical protein